MGDKQISNKIISGTNGSSGKVISDKSNVDYLQKRVDFLKEIIEKKEDKIKHFSDVNDLRDLERLEQMIMNLMRTINIFKQ